MAYYSLLRTKESMKLKGDLYGLKYGTPGEYYTKDEDEPVVEP